MNAIAILDFGSQYTQLIARCVRETAVYCELFPWDASEQLVMALQPKGFILSGGPASVYQSNAPFIPDYVFSSGLPVLGICYGMQILTDALRGTVAQSVEREYGSAEIEVIGENPLLPVGVYSVWMSHGDRIEELPSGFKIIAESKSSPIAAMGDINRNYFGVQFHPEVRHTPVGKDLLKRFVVDICGAERSWTPESIIAESVSRVQAQIGSGKALVAFSGGVDSSVAAALVHRAIGDQLIAIFVDTGLLRKGERLEVAKALHKNFGLELAVVDAADDFIFALRGVTEPEEKRRIIGERFIRIFEAQAIKFGSLRFLVQGTIYPDIVESSAPDRAGAARIKTHHNVGGLPEDMDFELVEPLRYLFKDEVRLVGETLGLPSEIVWRQPFPGPGLAVRCLGEVTPTRLSRLREADRILIEEINKAGLLCWNESTEYGQGTAQSFAVLLPIRSVGVMGDQRTYQEVVVIRAVTTDDFMTADWARLPHELLARVSNRIVNEVPGVNRVVYDITSKPPATIEWE